MSKDMIQMWVGNARNAEYGFIKAVTYALEQFEAKNNRPMYALIAFTNGKRFGKYKITEGYKMTQFATPLRHVMDKALSDVKFVFKDGNAGVKVGKNGGVNHDVLEMLKGWCESGNPIGPKSEIFKEFFAPEKVEKAFDPKVWAERAAKAHPDELEAMIAALQAQRG